MEVEIPYEKPLVIPVTMKVGTPGVPFSDTEQGPSVPGFRESWGDLPSWKDAA
jgi:hypothetical protein